jgi:hypothetical protein
MKDSHIEITGTSGYGAFSINDCLVSFDHCTVKVPDVGLIVANGKASGRFTGQTQVESDRFGVMWFRNTQGKVEVDPGVTFHTGETVFLIKGCTPELQVTGATLDSKTGSILTVMDLDDPNDTGAYLRDAQEADTYAEGRDLTTAIPGTDVVAHFRQMTLCGDFYNSTTNVKAVTGVLDPNAPKAPSAPLYSGGPGTPKGNAPGGPGGAGDAKPKDGEMPEFFKKMFGLDVPPAQNLALDFAETHVTGIISAATAKHRVPQITKYNREEIGEVDLTPAPAVNNGVSVSLDGQSTWTVTGTSYLTRLTLSDGAQVLAPAGKRISLTVDGTPTALQPGTLTGHIMVAVIE